MKQFVSTTERVYNPTPLEKVAKLHLTVSGIMGIDAQGDQIIDVHHINHPQSRYRGDNKISFGFIHHYAAMRDRFSDHLVNGAGGENILFEMLEELPEDVVGKRLFIRSSQDTLIEFTNVIPAPPCREFSIFCSQRPIAGSELKQALQWLDSGRRGYYAELIENDCQCYVQAGDTLFIQ